MQQSFNQEKLTETLKSFGSIISSGTRKRKSTLETKRASKSIRINFDSKSDKSQCHDEDDDVETSLGADYSKSDRDSQTKADKLDTPGISYSNFEDKLSELFIDSRSQHLSLTDILNSMNAELGNVEEHLKKLESNNRIMIATMDSRKTVFLI